MTKKQFFVDSANRVSWGKNARQVAWQEGKRVMFVVAGSDLCVEALAHKDGLFFSCALVAGLLRAFASDAAIGLYWERGERGVAIARMLPEEIRLDEVEGQRSVFLYPVRFPAPVLKEALDQAAAAVFARPVRKRV